MTLATRVPGIAELSPETRVRGSRRLDGAIALLSLVMVAVASTFRVVGDRVLTPDGTALGGSCWSRELFDLACPFCGMTRSVIAVFHGDFSVAWAMHPGGALIAMAAIGSALAIGLVTLTGGRPLSTHTAFWKTVEITAFICLIAGIARWFL